jgi:hypothetical protein
MAGVKGCSGRRPSLGENAGKRFNARITPSLYARLSAAAAMHDWSLTQEITRRLQESFDDGKLTRMGRSLSDDYAAVMFND